MRHTRSGRLRRNRRTPVFRLNRASSRLRRRPRRRLLSCGEVSASPPRMRNAVARLRLRQVVRGGRYSAPTHSASVREDFPRELGCRRGSVEIRVRAAPSGRASPHNAAVGVRQGRSGGCRLLVGRLRVQYVKAPRSRRCTVRRTRLVPRQGPRCSRGGTDLLSTGYDCFFDCTRSVTVKGLSLWHARSS
jgi:hypothetical protein